MDGHGRWVGLTAAALLIGGGWADGGAIASPPLGRAIAQTQTSMVADLRLRGERLHYAGEFDQAVTVLEQALTQAQSQGDRPGAAAVWVALGEVSLSLDDKTAAAAAATQALTLFQSLQDGAGEADALRVLAATQFTETPGDESMATAQQALALATEVGTPYQQGFIWADLGAFYILRQEYDLGLAAIAQAETQFATAPQSDHERAKWTYYEPLLSAWKGLAVFAQGDPPQGRRWLQQAIALSQQAAVPNPEAIAYFFQGVVRSGEGDGAGAVADYQAAAAIFATLENRAAQWEALHLAGTTLLTQGDNAAASDQPEAAIAWYEEAITVNTAALQLAQDLGDDAKTVRAFQALVNPYLRLSATAQAQATAALSQGDIPRADGHSAAMLAYAQQSLVPAQAALTLAQQQGDDSLLQQSYQTVFDAHAAIGDAYEAQGLLLRTQGRYAEALRSYQAGRPSYEAELAIRLAMGDPRLIAQARYQVTLNANITSQMHGVLGDYEAGIAASQRTIALAQQVPSRGLELLALSVLQQHYFDGSGSRQAAGDQAGAIAYAEQSLQTAQRALALAQQPLEQPDELPAAAALPDSSTVDTEAERQSWQADAVNQMWLSHMQLASIYDEADQTEAALAAYRNALVSATQLQDPEILFITLGITAVTHGQLSQYTEALALYDQLAVLEAQLGAAAPFSVALSRASIYDDLGRYPEAIAAYTAVLAQARDRGELNTEQTVLNNLGTIYNFQGDYDAALANYDTSLAITRTTRAALAAPDGLENLAEYCYLSGLTYGPEGGLDDPDRTDTYGAALGTFTDQLVAESAEYSRQSCISSTWNAEQKLLNNIAVVYTEQGRYGEAIALFEESLAIGADWGSRFDEADTLNNLGNTYLYKGEYDTAIDLYQRGLALRQDIGDRAGVAYSLNSLGTAYSWQGQYGSAIAAYQAALDLVQELGLKPLEPAILGNLGVLYMDQGRYEEAAAQYQTALTQAQTLGLLPDEAAQYSRLSDLAAHRGDYPQALAHAQAALALYQRMGARINESTVVGKIGSLDQAQGDFAAALTRHQAALAITQALDDQDDTAYGLLALGSTYAALGQLDRAEAFYGEGLTLFQRIGHVAGAAAALRHQGTLAARRSHPAAALTLYQEALAIYQETGSVAGELVTRIALGEVYTSLGDLAAAETMLQTALDLQRRLGTRAHEGQTLAALARVRQAQGQPAPALSLLQQALTLHQALGDRPRTASTLSDLGQLLAAQGQPELAVV
ncbi:MAG TPA: tetratricopeptide repeat protein, partial [Candidatus Obscuribacterales bacterium]